MFCLFSLYRKSCKSMAMLQNYQQVSVPLFLLVKFDNLFLIFKNTTNCPEQVRYNCMNSFSMTFFKINIKQIEFSN